MFVYSSETIVVRKVRQTILSLNLFFLGYSHLRGVMPFREMNAPRGNIQSRFGRYPHLHNMRNMGAGDTFFQNPFYY